MSRKRVTLSHLPRPCCDLLVLIRNTAPSFAMVRPGKDTPPLQQDMGTSVSMLGSGSTQVPCRAAGSTAWSREEPRWVCKPRV